MKINSKFLADLLKCCGLLMPVVVVTSCGKDKNKGKDDNKEQSSATESKPNVTKNHTQTTPVITSVQPEKPTQTHNEKPSSGQTPRNTTQPSTSQSVDDQKVTDLLKKAGDKHVVMNVGGNCFDLSVFFDIYSWVYGKTQNQPDFVKPEDLNIKHVNTIMSKGQMPTEASDVEKKFGINTDTTNWQDGKTYEYSFTASATGSDACKALECPLYNGLLKFLTKSNDLGFNETMFSSGKLNDSADLAQDKLNVVFGALKISQTK